MSIDGNDKAVSLHCVVMTTTRYHPKSQVTQLPSSQSQRPLGSTKPDQVVAQQAPTLSQRLLCHIAESPLLRMFSMSMSARVTGHLGSLQFSSNFLGHLLLPRFAIHQEGEDNRGRTESQTDEIHSLERLGVCRQRGLSSHLQDLRSHASNLLRRCEIPGAQVGEKGWHRCYRKSSFDDCRSYLGREIVRNFIRELYLCG